jgi:signal transduction histidine kinase/DNA-binding response OmpR family regulator
VGKPLSVLLVEDSDDDAALVLLTLRRSGFDIESERVDTAPALSAALGRREWDIVLSDYSMPSLSGLNALTIVQESGVKCPFIVVSGAIGEETAVELMRNGAHDCIMKDKLSRLPPAVERELGEARMRREREEALESLRRELHINATLADLSRNLIAIPDDVGTVAGLVLKYAKELTGSSDGFVAVIDPHTLAMKPLTFAGMGEADCGIGWPAGEDKAFRPGPDGRYPTLCGHALNSRVPFFENDPAGHPASRGLPEGHIPIWKFLAAPVMSGDRLVGQIAIANPGRDYAQNDLTAIGRLADLFSIALANHRNFLEKEQLSLQLRQIQKVEAIGTLAGGIAHDFNNILTPMIGYAEMVQMCLSRDSKVWAQQDQVLKACSRAKELVEQILALSRQTEEERKPTALGGIVREALRLLRSSLPATIAVKPEIDPRCSLVLADPTQIHQVIMNLCTNAYHAMRDGGGTLRVSLTPWRVGSLDAGPGKPPGEYVRLEVADDGCGMDRETIDKIFDPYFTTKKKGEGTGLGLSIVESIVRKHDGTIAVQSAPGEGTIFFIDLPAAGGDLRAVESTPAGVSSFAGEERVMVVDDVVEIVDMARDMLEGLGYTVEGYSSGPAALEAFASDPDGFDLVITDLTMPNLSGFELAKRILEIRPGMPIILCSGLSESVSDEKISSLGIRKFLKKPILLKEYGQAIRQALEGGKPPSKPPPGVPDPPGTGP